MRFREKKKKRKHSSLDLGISRQKKKITPDAGIPWQGQQMFLLPYNKI
jgi:hypothetical protein